MDATISILSHIKVESAAELARIENMRVDEIATIASRGQDIRIECKIVDAVIPETATAPSTEAEILETGTGKLESKKKK
jgi:hypothetical protein